MDPGEEFDLQFQLEHRGSDRFHCILKAIVLINGRVAIIGRGLPIGEVCPGDVRSSPATSVDAPA
jgi:hypothetical protein